MVQNHDVNSDAELKRLKVKCNTQLDQILALQKALEQAENQLSDYQNSVQEIARKSEENSDAFLDDNLDAFTFSAQLFKVFFSSAEAQECFLDERKNIVQNRPYKVAEYAELMRLLEDFGTTHSVEVNAPKVAQWWADLGLLLRDARGKITYPFTIDGTAVRTVRINKAALQLLPEVLL